MSKDEMHFVVHAGEGGQGYTMGISIYCKDDQMDLRFKRNLMIVQSIVQADDGHVMLSHELVDKPYVDGDCFTEVRLRGD